MKRKLYIFCLFIVLHSIARSQNIDSIKAVLKNAKHDSTRCHAINALIESEYEFTRLLDYAGQLLKICESYEMPASKRPMPLKFYASSFSNIGAVYYQQGEFNKALIYFSKSLAIDEQLGEKENIAISLGNIGALYFMQGSIQKSLECYTRRIKINEELNDKAGIAMCLTHMSNIYYMQGDIPKALDCLNRGLQIGESMNDKQRVSHCLATIAGIYVNQKENTKALEYLQKSIKIAEETGDSLTLSKSLINISVIYIGLNQEATALECLNRALKIQKQTGNKGDMAAILGHLGRIYQQRGDYDKAIEYHKNSLKILEEISAKREISFALVSIADVYILQEKYKPAVECLNKGLYYARELGFPENIERCAGLLSTSYKALGNHKEALEYYELYIQMRDSLANESNKKATIKSQLKYEYEKQAAKDSIRNAEKVVQENIKHEEAIKQQRLYTYGGAAGFGLMLVIAGISFRAYRNKQKANNIISEQKKLVEQQKHLVEEKQKEILDSIHYARRIQRALITNEKYIEKSMKKRG